MLRVRRYLAGCRSGFAADLEQFSGRSQQIAGGPREVSGSPEQFSRRRESDGWEAGELFPGGLENCCGGAAFYLRQESEKVRRFDGRFGCAVRGAGHVRIGLCFTCRWIDGSPLSRLRRAKGERHRGCRLSYRRVSRPPGVCLPASCCCHHR